MAETTKKEEVKEIRASSLGVHISPRKARLAANMVKNMGLDEALLQLRFAGKKAAGLIEKALRSAAANAEHNFQIQKDLLFVKNLTVDGGRVFRRFAPRAQGRAFPILKRTSRINVILGVRGGQPPRAASAGKKARAASLQRDAAAASAKKPREKKPEQKQPQEPGAGREDVKGKTEVHFNRKGNM